MFRAKKSSCENVAVQKIHNKNVTLYKNAAVKIIIVKNCRREKVFPRAIMTP